MLHDPDPRWFPLINEFARDTPWLHPVMIGYAEYAIVVFAALLLAGWWIARRSGDLNLLAAAVWAPLGALVAVAINQPIVSAINGPRPYAVLPDILVLVQRGSDPSFPSDYAVLAGAIAAGLWLVSDRLGAVALLAAAVMAFAGVYIGADYPHDVLAGLAVGNAVGVIGLWATRPILVRLLRRAEQIRLLRWALTVHDTAELASR
ncbi:MAG TPA: phosphatase PAP2 family protein [Mycobacterium sp.]|nr:phosphatase PAP2 family protein [Mycobacterium sp.]